MGPGVQGARFRIAEVTRKPTAKQIAKLMDRNRNRVAHYMKPVPKPARGRPLELPEGCANREDHARLLMQDLVELQDTNACTTAYDVRTPAQGRGPGDARVPVPAFGRMLTAGGQAGSVPLVAPRGWLR